tara:strand:- start:113 stop:451 length:339 start_codon:yes stop_codon:yes gene_type:complete
MPFTTENCAIVGNAFQAVHTEVSGMTERFEAARQTFLSGIASDGFNFVALQKLRNAAEIRGVLVGTTSRIDPWIAGSRASPSAFPRMRSRAGWKMAAWARRCCRPRRSGAWV